MAGLDHHALILLAAGPCLFWLLALLPPRLGRALHLALWGAAGAGWLYFQIESGLYSEAIFFAKWLFWQLMMLMMYRQSGPFYRFSRRVWSNPKTD